MIVKGIELMQMIADGKIKDGTIFLVCGIRYIYSGGCLWKYRYGKINEEMGVSVILSSELFEILEDKTDEIECINAYNLIEAPYMAECLDKNNHTEFMELLKQSELELVDKIEKLTKTVNKLNKQNTSKD